MQNTVKNVKHILIFSKASDVFIGALYFNRTFYNKKIRI